MSKKLKKEDKLKSERYFEAVGRRKTAVARVRLTKGSGKIVVNSRPHESYFPARLRRHVTAPFEKLNLFGKFDAQLKIRGGGIKAQVEAAEHGIARALVKAEPEYKKQLRGFGFLTRDPRMVERKKYGLKKARRAPQWAKR